MDRIAVAVALGSNLGDRRGHLDFAVSRLAQFISDLQVSTYHETAPVDVPGQQGDFLNAAATGAVTLAPRDVLETLLEIERERGRERPHPRAARTLDLDLILYGNHVINEPGLVVPHERWRERTFVLAPLAEIAGDWRDPVTGRTVRELLAAIAP